MVEYNGLTHIYTHKVTEMPFTQSAVVLDLKLRKRRYAVCSIMYLNATIIEL